MNNPHTEAYKRYVLFSLLLVYIFNFVDRQILALLMESIKLDLNLSDTQLGFMSGIAFAIFYTTLGIPIARLADRYNRVTIISLAVAIWSGMTVLSGMAANFWQLVMARIGVGIGEAGCTPPAHSLISDYFPQQERSRAIAIYMMGVPLGILVGFLIGGWINEVYGWRFAFIALGLPGLVIAVIVKFTIKEPLRGRYDQEIDSEENFSIRESFQYLWQKRAFRYLLVAMSLTTFVGGGSAQWQATFFIRNHGMNTGELGAWLSIMGGLCGAIGIYVGGYLAERYGRDNEPLQMRAIMVAILLLLVAGIISMLVDNRYIALCWVGVSNILYFLHYGPAYALVVSLAQPRMRAMASAIVLLAVNLIGGGFGPQAVGLLSDVLSASLGDQALRWAIIINFSVLLGAAYCFYQVRYSVRDDLVMISMDRAMSARN